MSEQPITTGDQRTGNATGVTALIPCPVCEREVPDGEFCGACGAHLASDEGSAAGRHHAFAANPAEHVLHLTLVSTLFPHLPHRRSAPFRIALLLVAGALLVLGLLRLTGPSVAAAALAVPILYLIYLYEVEVYEDEPVLVIGTTVVLGMLLGIPWALVSGPIVSQTSVENATIGAVLLTNLVGGVLFPLLAQLLMLVGAYIIYLTRQYDEALDGFTFGAAGALGFTLSTTLVNLLPELREGLVSGAPVVFSVLDILQRGLLVPIVNASTAGLIAGALWLQRGRTRALRAHGWSTSLGVMIVVVVVTQVGLALMDVSIRTFEYRVAIRAAVTVLLILLVRVALHHMLLAEAVEVDIGPPTPCFHCHRIVPRMAFCPHCGVATRATPKTGAGRQGRTFR